MMEEALQSVEQAKRPFEPKEKIVVKDRKGRDSTDYAVIDILHPRKKGIDTWLRGYRYPFDGFPDKQAVLTVGTVKRIIPTVMRFVFWKPLMLLLGLLFLFSKKTFLKLIHRGIEAFIDFAYAPTKRHFMNPDRFKRPVRELYRVLSIGAEREMRDKKGAMRKKWEMGRDILCMFLEYDNAYLLRLQDIVGEINLKELKLDKRDKYYVNPRNDYDFCGGRQAVKDGKINPLGPPKDFKLMDENQLKRFESRRAAVQAEFDKMTQEREILLKQVRQIQARLDEIGTQMLRLQGRFAEISEEEGHLKEIQKTEADWETKREKEKKEEGK